MIQIEDDVLAHPADGQDAAVLERSSNLTRGRFQRLLLLSQPDGFDDVSRHSLGEAAGNGFDFGEFRHVSYDRVASGVRLFLQKRALLQFAECLLELQLRVHHDGPVPGNGLLQWLAGDQKKANAVVTRLYRDFVAAIEQD